MLINQLCVERASSGALTIQPIHEAKLDWFEAAAEKEVGDYVYVN